MKECPEFYKKLVNRQAEPESAQVIALRDKLKDVWIKITEISNLPYKDRVNYKEELGKLYAERDYIWKLIEKAKNV